MMSQNALAKQLGISKSYLSMILSGQRTPRTELRNKLCTLGLFTDEANLTAHNPKVVGSNPTPATKNDSSLNNLPLRELLILLLDEGAQRKLRLRNLQNTELFELWDNELILRYRTPNTLHESRRFFGHFHQFLGEFPPTVELGKGFLTSFSNCKPATVYRYNALLKQFFDWLGYSWTVKIRMPKQLPEYVEDKDVRS
jgi:transcriptional regulator with XRE-family HTH domain